MTCSGDTENETGSYKGGQGKIFGPGRHSFPMVSENRGWGQRLERAPLQQDRGPCLLDVLEVNERGRSLHVETTTTTTTTTIIIINNDDDHDDRRTGAHSRVRAFISRHRFLVLCMSAERQAVQSRRDSHHGRINHKPRCPECAVVIWCGKCFHDRAPECSPPSAAGCCSTSPLWVRCGSIYRVC